MRLWILLCMLLAIPAVGQPVPEQREFVAVKYGDVNEVKAQLSQLLPGLRITVDTRLATLILEGAPTDIERAKQLLAELDRPLNQVMLDLKLIYTRFSLLARLGAFDPDARLDEQTCSDRWARGSLPVFVPKYYIGYGVSRADTTVLASPRVATLSGQGARFHFVGQAYARVADTPKPLQMGIEVDIASTILDDGHIYLGLGAQVVSPGWFSRPRQAQARLQVKDGDTVVIGGLLRQRELEEFRSSPLGASFEPVDRADAVVLLVSPHIMK